MHYVGSTAGLASAVHLRRGLLMDERVCALQRRASVPPAPEGGHGKTAILPVPCLSFYDFRPLAILRIAARLPSTSSSVVAQLETLIRIAVRPCH